MKKTLILTLLASLALPAMAVTDKEMEEAKVITAKAYLRYANDGSGYLDDISVKSMSELTSKLKAKEKENLVAFNSVKVPSDFAKWDKKKLEEFWGVTFFTSPALSEKGKAAKSRVRKQLAAMNVAAVTTAEATKEVALEENKTEVAETQTSGPTGQAGDIETPSADGAREMQQEILADQEAIEKDAEDAQSSTPREQSNTWVYVMVLAILVGVVIWLVAYAARLMKRQPGSGTDENSDEGDLREQTKKAIAKKNEELADAHKRLQAEEERNAQISMELERMKLDRKRLEETVSKLREEISRLNADSREENREQTSYLKEKIVSATHIPDPEEKSTRRERSDSTRDYRRNEVDNASEERILKTIFLGRANSRGIFVRADRRLNPGNTIYRLDTNDGLVGTFHVVDEPMVVETALSSPEEYLAYGCTGEDLRDTAGVSRIVTESSGTAIFENGYWKVLRKTRIRYE